MKIDIVTHDQVLPAVHVRGQWYCEAPKSGVYSVRVTNDRAMRRLVVLSVDGVNVLDGEDAGYGGAGYVLAPWETVDVPGWRRSDKTVAAFEFRAEGESYAAKTGRGTANVGVIGAAVFEERVVPPWAWNRERSLRRREPTYRIQSVLKSFGSPNADTTYSSSSTVFGNNETSCSVGPEMSFGDVGTGYGAETTFHTHATSFQRATTTPSMIVELRYATRERLASWGIIVSQNTKAPPCAFPASAGPSVPPPPGWNGGSLR